MLQFQSLGTLSATSGWLLPGVVGLAPGMGLAEMGLAGTVWLPCWGVRSLVVLALEEPEPLRPRHILKSP